MYEDGYGMPSDHKSLTNEHFHLKKTSAEKL